MAVNTDPPVIRIEDVANNNFSLLDESIRLRYYVPNGVKKYFDVDLKRQSGSPACSVTPPANAVKRHNIKSTVDVDFLIEDFTVTGECNIEKYDATVVTSDKDVTWLVPISKGVRVPVQSDMSLIGDYTVTVTATYTCGLTSTA